MRRFRHPQQRRVLRLINQSGRDRIDKSFPTTLYPNIVRTMEVSMQLISCHDGRLLTLDEARLGGSSGRVFRTGLEALDDLLPGGAFACGSVHELLSQPMHGKPLFAATILARGAVRGEPGVSGPAASGVIVWCDPEGELYPPALAARGISLDRLFLLRPKPADLNWAVAECLRCKGVSAVVAAVPRLSRVEARRLQLAAECGGGTGILLRPTGSGADVYAAATRWLVRPAPGERTLQRWTIQLLHGHGGRLGNTVTLECCRENNLVRAFAPMADRPGEEKGAETVVARAS